MERLYIFADFDSTLNYGYFNRLDTVPDISAASGPANLHFRFDGFGTNGPWDEGSGNDFGAITDLAIHADLSDDSLLTLGSFSLTDIDPNQPQSLRAGAAGVLLIAAAGLRFALTGKPLSAGKR